MDLRGSPMSDLPVFRSGKITDNRDKFSDVDNY